MEEVRCGQAVRPVKQMEPPNLQPVVSPTSWPVRTRPGYDVMVAGAGLAGGVLARLLADRAGRQVLVVDPRGSLGEIGHEDAGSALQPPVTSPPQNQRRRRAAAYLAQFSRCGPCNENGIACIHPAEPDARLLERLLDHPGIDLLLGVRLDEARSAYGHDLLVYTGRLEGYEEIAFSEPATTFVAERAGFAGGTSEEVVAAAFAAFERIVGGSAALAAEQADTIASAA